MDTTGFYDTLAAEYHLLFADWAASRAKQGALFDGLIREALGSTPPRHRPPSPRLISLLTPRPRGTRSTTPPRAF